MMNSRHRSLLLFGAFSWLVSCGTNISTKPGVVVREERTIESLVSAHTSPRIVFSVRGKRFEDVQGFSPYYIEVPGRNAIVFVTEKARLNNQEFNGTEVHFFDLDKNSDTVIVTFEPGLGNYIGCTNELKRADAYLTAPNSLVIRWRLYHVGAIWHADLATRSVQRIEKLSISEGKTNVTVIPGR